MKILMVCLGNICRSPLAEGILQHKANLAGFNWTIDSAGTNGYHTGEAPHPLSQKVARIHGINISHQRSRKFVAEDLIRFDKIFAMAEDVRIEMKRIAGKHWNPEKVELILNVLEPNANMDVPDPWYGEEHDYHEVFDLLNNACEKLLTNYHLPITNHQ